jgi:serine phosphatase RsbU (regulator of sigma subunit)
MLQQYAQDSHKIQDGMDIALMRFNLAKQELVWAGAKRPLWHYHAQTQQLTEHKSNVYPIGGLENIKKTFTQTVLTLQTNDIFYTFTDGFTDQFGEKGKFGTKKLRNILPSITNLPLLQQAQILQNHLKTWQGTTKQTDDILFVGLKI